MSTVSNTTVLSNFATIGELDVLRRLFGKLLIPTEVYEEIRAGQAEGYPFYAGFETLVWPIAEEGWIQLTSLGDEREYELFGSLLDNLDSGEAACLTIAHNRGWLMLTDDLAARRRAADLGILVSGSVGCLVLAVERELCSLDEANAWLAEMIRQGHSHKVGSAGINRRDAAEEGAVR